MKFIKKNQVVVAVIAIMLIAAGYLNFTNNNQSNSAIETGILTDAEQMAAIGDAKLASSNPQEENTAVISTAVRNDAEENVENTQETVQTNTETTVDEYFTKSRLERDTMYSQMIESYQKILEKTTISETQKNTAQKEITKINEQKNAIMITENLLKTKGFEDLIIFINDKSINVIVKSKELKENQVAQIQNIIIRELGSDVEDIHISNKE